MNVLIHGDDIIKTRQRLAELKDLNKDDRDGPLFSNQNLVIFEGIKNILTPINIADHIIIWEDKKLSVAQIAAVNKLVPSIKIEEYNLSPIVFKFVESIKPGNQKEMIALLRQYLKKNEAEIAMAMVIRQIRLLLTIDDKIPTWQKNKLERQAKLFSENQLQELLEELLKIDYRVKTGQSGITLADQLELWLLNL